MSVGLSDGVRHLRSTEFSSFMGVGVVLRSIFTSKLTHRNRLYAIFCTLCYDTRLVVLLEGNGIVWNYFTDTICFVGQNLTKNVTWTSTVGFGKEVTATCWSIRYPCLSTIDNILKTWEARSSLSLPTVIIVATQRKLPGIPGQSYMVRFRKRPTFH